MNGRDPDFRVIGSDLLTPRLLLTGELPRGSFPMRSGIALASRYARCTWAGAQASFRARAERKGPQLPCCRDSGHRGSARRGCGDGRGWLAGTTQQMKRRQLTND